MDDPDERFEVLRRQAAAELARLGAEGRFQLVAAESCTGGLIGASLTANSGASQWFCGSSVVYQEPTKFGWLNIPEKLVEQYSAESLEVTAAMSRAILAVTAAANLSVATTGHLESDPQRTRPEPHVFVSISKRADGATNATAGDGIESSEPIAIPLTGASRRIRQQEAAALAMQQLVQFLQD